MLLLHYLIFIVRATTAEWRINVLNIPNQELYVNEKFSLHYMNVSNWNTSGDYSWYAQSSACGISDIRSPTAVVVCTVAGIFSFGLRNDSNKHEIIQHKSVVIRPSNYIYGWQAETTKVSNLLNPSNSSYSIKIWIDLLEDIGNKSKSKAITKELYHKNFQPSVCLFNMLNGLGEHLAITFDVLTSVWVTNVASSSLGTVATVKISSANKSSLVRFQVKDTKIKLQLPKYDLAMISGIELIHSIVSLSNRIISDPFTPHVGVLIFDNTMMFLSDGFKQLSQDIDAQQSFDLGLITNILFLPEHFVITSSTGDVILFNRDGNETVIPRDGYIYWSNMFSCRHIPKGLPHSCDVIFLLSSLTVNHLFMYDVAKKTVSMKPIPFCSNMQLCTFDHIEVNIVHDLVRVLYTDCTGSSCMQIIADYYFKTDSWNKVVEYDKMFIESFHFLPVYSLDMLLMMSNGLCQVKGTQNITRYLYKGDEKNNIINLLTWNDKALITFSSGYGVFFQYGNRRTYKIFVGNDTYLHVNDDLVHAFSNPRKVSATQFIFPLQIELDAASNGQSVSVLRFSSNIVNEIYILDRIDEFKIELVMVAYRIHDHSIKILYDETIGLKVVTSVEEKSTAHLIQKSYKCVISLKSSNPSERSMFPRSTVVTFVLDNYDGYLSKELESKSLFISIGCPSERHLHLQIPSINSLSCDQFDLEKLGVPSEEHSHTLCVDALIEEEVKVTTMIYANEVSLRQIGGSIDMSVLHGDADKIVFKQQASGTNVFAGQAAGVFVLEMSLNTNESLCSLDGYMLIKVKEHYTDDRAIIIVVSITIGLCICAACLTVSFFIFKKQTAKEHAAEAELQKRQQQLRYLASLQHYQDQMDVKQSTAVAGVARRRSSGTRRNSSIISEGIKVPKINIMGTLEEE